MRQAIKDFLYSQIEAEPGLTACLIIHTLNTDTEKVQTGENSYNFFLAFSIQNLLSNWVEKIKFISNLVFPKVAFWTKHGGL